MKLTHLNQAGRARMVDVTGKEKTNRRAKARGDVYVNPETFRRIQEGTMGKGDVLAVAQVAGIMAAKKTWDLIPMCHPLMLTGVDLNFTRDEELHRIEITAEVHCLGETGVEMEALTAVSVAALTIYDMCKAIQKDIRIEGIHLVEKCGGKSGRYMSDAVVCSVNISEKKGEPKHPVTEIFLKKDHGILGDAHAGDWHRQISLLAEESIDQMRHEGLTLESGVFAENINTRGLILHELPIGTLLQIGEAKLRVTQIGKECHNDCAIRRSVGNCVMPTMGIFAVVEEEGVVRAGDRIERIR